MVSPPAEPASASEVYRFPSGASPRAVIEEFLCDRGLDQILVRAIVADGLHLPDGARIALTHGEVIEDEPLIAVIVRERGSQLRVLLVASTRTVREIAEDCAARGWSAEGVILSPLPRPNVARLAEATNEKLRFLARLLAESEDGPPSTIHFGPEFCPRCQDHPLALDPANDPRSRLTDERICIACAHREQLRPGGATGTN